MIRITSKRNGFRRAGIAHPKEPTVYPDGRFTEDDLAILKAESQLTVEVIEDDSAGAGDPEAMTVAKLTETLQEWGVAIPKSARKADLVELYNTAIEEQR